MNALLERIIADRRRRQPLSIDSYKMQRLHEDCMSLPSVRSLQRALEQRPAVIAEIKRCSPSRGELGGYRAPGLLATAYERSGAAAISVLTNEQFFGMHKNGLSEASASVGIPVLRKEFIISEFDILETRLLGADAVLLIVRLLDDDCLRRLYTLSREIGLEVLLEVHSEAELERALALKPELIGINARDLDSLELDLRAALRLAGRVPQGIRIVAESGIRGIEDMRMFMNRGIHSFLIGSELLEHDRPEKRLAEMLSREVTHEAV
ncbi:indole-3-glycerol-phosphate synthase [bacterium]|nr:indole-3-glycerol-phosphate synthase [bacterium]